ncbi:MAG: LamG-like jellyroll fold domain-containing protein [Kiritimatiellia bacterium]
MGKLVVLPTVLLSLSAAVADPVSSEGYDLKDLTDTIGSQHSISTSLSPYFGAFDNDVTSGGVRLEDYTWRAEFRLSEDVVAALGEETLTDVPVLVRLSSDLPNFSLASFSDSARRDLLFLDEAGTVLAHEIDSVDSEGGLLVWVKVPELTASTVLTCCYGGPVNPQALNAADTWSGYVGVWHLNAHDASGTTPDATGHGLDATGADFTGIAGPFGSPAAQTTKAMTAPDFEPVHQVGGTFSCSLWFRKPTQAGEYTTFVSKKTGLAWDAATGWYLEMSQSATTAKFISSGNAALRATVPDVRTNWTHFHVVCNGSTVNVYVNGDTTPVLSTLTTVKASSVAFSLLGASQQGDEFRLKKTADSALRASIEYKAMADVDFLSTEGFVPVDATATVFGAPSASVSNEGAVLVTIPVEGGLGDVSVIYNETTEVALGSVATTPCTFTDTPAVPADTIWSFSAKGVNDKGTVVEKASASGVLNGVVNVTVTRNADERDLVEGVFTITRPSNGEACTYPLSVNLSWSGTAGAGKNYEDTLPSSVMIPAGAASVTVTVVPMFDSESTEDETLVLTVAPGPYRVGTPAEMTILNLSTPTGFNTWIAKEAGKASDAANWSQGVPQAGQNILFDGRFSTKDCTWDGGVNGLTDSVASWKQCSDYTGTVTFKTTFAGGFQALSVMEDVDLQGGSWTHPAGDTNVSTPTYRLKTLVGGDFTLGAQAKVDLKAKGFAGGQKPEGAAAGGHAASSAGYGKVYGNVYAPTLPGAGAEGANKNGGGAFWLEAAGAVTLDGEVSVRADEQNGTNPAAGSVYVKAASCGGTGHIRADYAQTGYYNGSGGSGGRVAIVLTEADALDLPEANVSIHGINAGATGGGGGTFFLKCANDAHGTLILDDTRTKSYGARWHQPTAITAIPSGETWTFDAIKIKNYGMLAIPAGTTLVLPNGPLSVTATHDRQGGLLYQGGALEWGKAPYAFAGGWIFQANAPYVFDGDVVVKSGGNLGCLALQGKSDFSDMTRCDITVNGNLIVEQGGAVYATGGGPNMPINRVPSSYHGGSTVDSTAAGKVYDSVFNPAYPGFTAASGDQAESSSGGGLVKLTVNGTLTVDGLIVSDGTCTSGDGSGSGGTINIVAERLADSKTGSIHANALDHSSHYSGGGGRVAVRLTDGAFSDYWIAHIQAKGKTILNKGDYWKDKSSSAGTVYLQEKGVAEKAGTIYVRNDGEPLGTESATMLPSVKTSLTPSDQIKDYKRANLVLGANAVVRAAESFQCNRVSLEKGCSFDLCGKTVVVSSMKYDGTSLLPKTYVAGDVAFLLDSTGSDGTLVVTGGGFAVIIR